VYEPLRRFHSAEFELAPLSIFVEPARIQELLGTSSQFESSVRYLFEKQLAEAELIILTKTELLNPEEVRGLTTQLQRVAGKSPIRLLSARTGVGVNEWVDQLLSVRSVGNTGLDLDYEIYGQAEASLGWLNATVDLVSDQEFLLAELGEAVVVKNSGTMPGRGERHRSLEDSARECGGKRPDCAHNERQPGGVGWGRESWPRPRGIRRHQTRESARILETCGA